MNFSLKYEQAFKAGYKQGMYAALEGSKAQTVIRNDLLHVYGHMCLRLFNRGWKRETIEALIENIIESWAAEVDEANFAYDNGLPVERIEDKVERLTGIHLEQCVTGLMELDKRAVKGN